MFATCPALETLKHNVSSILSTMLGKEIVLSPQLIVLGVGCPLSLSQNQSFLFIAMTVFRLCLATHWLDLVSPSGQQWLERFQAIYRLERAVYSKKGRKAKAKGSAIWAPLMNWPHMNCE